MIWPAHSVGVWIGLAALALVFIGLFGRAWLGRSGRNPGMRFPARRRTDGVKPGLRARLVHLPLALRGLAIASLVVALTRPQIVQAEAIEVEGIDIVVAFDMSGSMASVDISDGDLVRLQNQGRQPKDRFSIAVEVLRDFIGSREHDRVSLVTFGKEAFLQFPLTLDYGVMLSIFDEMALGDIDGTGTVIGNALGMSLNRLSDSKAKTQVIILLTDGEDKGSNLAPMEVAREAAKGLDANDDGDYDDPDDRRKVRIFTILVGTDDQSRLPTELQDVFSGQRIYKKTENPVNPKLLEDIADETGGRFFRAGDKKKLERDFQEILDDFEKSRLVDASTADPTELFPLFVFLGLGLLALEVLLSQTVLRRFP